MENRAFQNSTFSIALFLNGNKEGVAFDKLEICIESQIITKTLSSEQNLFLYFTDFSKYNQISIYKAKKLSTYKISTNK